MYRENIYDIIGNTGEKVSKLAIPKNTGLKGYAWEVLKEAGLRLEEAEQIEKGKLRLGDLTLILKRGEDIPQFVMDYATRRGEVVLGVTGDDLLDEFRLRVPQNPLKVENTYDWFDPQARYFRPTLCFINKTGAMEDVPLEARITINSKYRFTSEDYLKKNQGTKEIGFVKTTYNGDVEITVAEETADCCIDTVYSGKTLDDNGLKVVQKIRFSDLVVVSPLKKEESLIGKAITREYQQIQNRKGNPTDSYTSKLLTEDPEAIFKDASREVMEMALAYYGVGKGELVGESADVIFRVLVALARKDRTLDDLAKEMAKRQK